MGCLAGWVSLGRNPPGPKAAPSARGPRASGPSALGPGVGPPPHGRETLAEAAGRHLAPIAPEAAAPGDVLLFALRDDAPAKHCGVLSEGGRMVHAIESHPVQEVTIGPWWRRRTRFAFVFPDPPEA